MHELVRVILSDCSLELDGWNRSYEIFLDGYGFAVIEVAGSNDQRGREGIGIFVEVIFRHGLGHFLCRSSDHKLDVGRVAIEGIPVLISREKTAELDWNDSLPFVKDHCLFSRYLIDQEFQIGGGGGLVDGKS